MPADVFVFHKQRVTMVRFQRKGSGDPVLDKPDMDDRSVLTPEFGAVVGVTEGDAITVELERIIKWMDITVPLFVTSSDLTSLTIDTPADGALPNTQKMDIKLQSVSKSGAVDKREAKVQVRVGSVTGTIIHELTVWVFSLVRVRVTPHLVTIGQTGSTVAAVTPIANIANIIPLVQAVWRPCGIDFQFGAVVPEAVNFATAGVVSDSPFPGELRTLLNTNWVPNTINAYFVNQIGTGSTLGYGFSRSSAVQFHTGNPGIILADRTASAGRYGLMHWANDLAHEAGHFFALWHPDNVQPPNEREDMWSKRMLMHNFNQMWGPNPWPRSTGTPPQPFQFRSRFADAGYGANNRGCLLTMKHISKLQFDAECITARTTINSTAGPY